jgi:hypothetical protein
MTNPPLACLIGPEIDVFIAAVDVSVPQRFPCWKFHLCYKGIAVEDLFQVGSIGRQSHYGALLAEGNGLGLMCLIWWCSLESGMLESETISFFVWPVYFPLLLPCCNAYKRPQKMLDFPETRAQINFFFIYFPMSGML